jgi:prepilin-type N-terminal cleavage/methylation domain-containing protein
MNRRGFTIVELVIVIAIMGVLLILTVVNLRGSQISARDEQRKADIDAISQNIEIFYRNGTTSSTNVGVYPATTIIGSETTAFRDIDPKSLIAPTASSSSFVAATNTTQTTAGVTPQPSSASDTYVYQPLKTTDGGVTWTLCTSSTDDCRRFNLYYWHETDNTVVMVQSRNR